VLRVSGILDRLLVCFFCFVLTLKVSGQGFTQEEKRISSLLALVETENRIVGELISENLTNLPVGIKKTISGTKIIIAIDSARLTPQGMIISAFTQVKLPGSVRPVSFAARNVMVTPSGLSQTTTTRLVLISETQIDINDQLKILLPADGRNFIDWDCNGFRSVNLNGIFEFSNEFFIPDPLLSRNKNRVTAGFEVNTSDLKSILISTSIEPFMVRGLGDMTFVAKQVTADMSDLVNCQGFAIPAGYQNIFSDAPQLWRGFFIKELTVLLPSELSSSTERAAIIASDLIIDEFGLSGYFSATNVLPFNKGNASGWPFSVDMVTIGICQNKLTGGELTGAIGIPFLGSDTLSYLARIAGSPTGLQYNFAVQINSERDFAIPFGGTVKLGEGCIFGMSAVNGKFIPSAILNGTLTLQNDLVKLEGLRFEGLHLVAESPYVLGGTFASSAGAAIKLSGFDAAVNSITLAILSGNASLVFDVKVALMNKSEKGVSASTRFFVNASLESQSGASDYLSSKQKWRYDGTVVQKIFIKGNVSIFSINGGIDLLKNDPVFGNGFRGEVGLMINKILKDTAKVEIRFGTKDTYKYWYAKIDIPLNIQVGTAVTLKKLAGGVYCNMEKRDLFPESRDYMPKENGGLGFIAQAGLSVKDEKLFYADVLFEIAFNKNNGVRNIGFTGNGQFFSGDTGGGAKVPVPATVPVSATVNMIFDNENDIFHANLKVYMNIANAIRGIGPDGLLGEAVIHCDPSDWYIYIGRPSMPLGVNVLGFSQTQSYFMAGTKIENMPLPPSEVASIIRDIDLDFMKSESGVASGKGMAFGIRFNANAGVGKEKGFVYAYFNAGAGADILLKNYGTVQCAGRSGPIGINGWYASGQGYAYLTGKIGVRVKKSEFDIMSVAAALLLQAKMPNPSWFQGNIAARYSILGGLVKGKVNVAVTLGEECVIVTNGNEPAGIKLIGDIKPAEGSSKVDVFASPQVAFNTNIDREFGMINMGDKYAVYRVRLDYFKLLTSDNKTVNGIVQWNNEQDLAMLKLKDILPGNQTITSSVKVHIEKKSPAGVWEALSVDPEVAEIKFVTGEEPASLPENNVVYSYPVRNQYNFYRHEYPKGYIKLGVGQPNIFSSESGGVKWSYLARFKSASGDILEAAVSYNDSEAMLYFDIPKTLTPASVYDMTIVRRPSSGGSLDRNLQRSELFYATTNAADSLSMAKNQLSGTINSETETILHSYSFRSSIYSTFGEKLNSMRNWSVQYAIDATLMSIPGIKTTLNETFDKYEIEGSGTDFNPLVFAEAERGPYWIDSHVNPQVYELYGTNQGIALSRNTNLLGVFPLKAMVIYDSGERGYVLDGSQSHTHAGDVFIRYNVPHYVYSDFSELRNKAAALYLGRSGIPPQAQRLLAGSIDDISRGNYPFRINYRLPGINVITTFKEFNINY
jgi:hypothetical protein